MHQFRSLFTPQTIKTACFSMLGQLTPPIGGVKIFLCVFAQFIDYLVEFKNTQKNTLTFKLL